jgi:adenosine kinase
MTVQKGKVIVLGSLAFDYIMGFDSNFCHATEMDKVREEYQSTITANSKKQHFGGTAGNIAYNLGLLNIGQVSLYGSVGKDFDQYKDHITVFGNIELGVDVHEDEFTAACYIVNDVKANQMIIFHGGALDRCKNIDLREKIQDPEHYTYAINSSQSVDAMINFAEQLYELGIPQIFDPGQQTPLFPKELLKDVVKKSDILIGNKFEIKKIQEKTEMTKEELLEDCRAIITTLGEEGSELMYKSDNKTYKTIIPIFEPKEIKDTTGAGDGYRAGILSGLMLDMTLLDSCRLGAIVASFVIETTGAQTHKYTISEVRKRFNKTYDYIPPELEGIKEPQVETIRES